ncbi:hypothetical protein [Clostridium botulinum]
MKKILTIFLILVSSTVFMSCSSKSTDATNKNKTATQQKTNKKEEIPTQEELKKKAVEVNYTELKNNPEKNKNKKVYIKGHVSVILQDSHFTFENKNGDNYETYSVTNLSNIKELNENDVIKLYGVYTGNDDAGFPLIKAHIIEKDKTEITSKDKVTTEVKEEENIPKVVTSNYKAKHGELLEANKLGKKLTIKLKISPSYNNKATIHQNGFNIEDLILNQGGDQFDEINYWAVADMEDGSESKVISFTLDKNLINAVKNKNIVGNQIVEKANDVWILPSLKN